MAIVDSNILVPSEVVGPITLEYARKRIEEDGPCTDEAFRELISDLWDWDWDKIIVRPLVKIRTEIEDIPSEIDVPRIHLFPYRDLTISPEQNENSPSL